MYYHLHTGRSNSTVMTCILYNRPSKYQSEINDLNTEIVQYSDHITDLGSGMIAALAFLLYRIREK